jgi:POT family proton-dependent oligopeptide transporter
LIYDAGPCYHQPLVCPGAEGREIPNHVNVFLQVPTYFILAICEIFAIVTLSEYTYSKAPIDMKAVVQALGQLAAAAGSAIGVAITPFAHDPKLVYMYTGLAVGMAVIAAVFWWRFKKYNAIERKQDRKDRARLGYWIFMNELHRQDSYYFCYSELPREELRGYCRVIMLSCM